MIVTDLTHVEQQIRHTPGMQKAIEFLRRPDLLSVPDGRTEIDGDRVYAMVFSYETIAAGEPLLEAHRKYLDVQFVASGQEIILWAPLERLHDLVPYDPAREALFGKAEPAEITPVLVRAGQLAVFYPEDAHAPKRAAGAPARVKKFVVKVAV